jgi:ParB family chromosome partitioning protein
VENIQRADLNVLEEALAYQALKDEFGLSDAVIARRVGKSRVAVVNTRRLIRLVPEARQALLDQTMSAGHGRALLRFEAPDEQVAALTLLLRHGMSVREVEQLAELALHDRLDPAVRSALLHGRITIAHAQLLLRVDDLGDQRALLDGLLTQGVSVGALERVVSRLATGMLLDEAGAALPQPDAHPVTPSRPRGTRAAPEDEQAERLFELLLATPVQIARTAGAIRLTITLFDETQLQELYDRLGGTSC